VVVAALLALCAVVGALGYRRFVTWYVIRECRMRGVQVDPAAIELTSRMVRLRDTRFTLIGVTSLGAHADTIEVELSSFAPTHVAIHGLGLELNGTVTAAADEAGQWVAAHKESYELPLQVDGLTLLWRDERKSLPWLSLHKATLAPEPGGACLKTREVTIWGKNFKQVVTAWKNDKPEVVIGIGADDPANAAIRIDLTRSAPYALKVAWKQAPLTDLASILGITMPPRGISAEGVVELHAADLIAPVDGSVHLVLHNFVPPHPAELNGVVTGNHTTVDSKLTISQDRSKVALSDAKVVAGSFQLDGTGQVQRVESYGLIGLKLSGTIPCSSISVAAAAGRMGKLGSLLGGLIGDVAQRALTGVIAVSVTIDADTRNMDAIKVEDRIGIGCSLRLL
jgi:ADP-dependent NAD(P)H-hydrate dehydratase / NAD(P)H-hydrate epimerase